MSKLENMDRRVRKLLRDVNTTERNFSRRRRGGSVSRYLEGLEATGPTFGDFEEMVDAIESASEGEPTKSEKAKLKKQKARLHKAIRKQQSLLNKIFKEDDSPSSKKAPKRKISGGGGMMSIFKKGKSLIEKMKDL